MVVVLLPVFLPAVTPLAGATTDGAPGAVTPGTDSTLPAVPPDAGDPDGKPPAATDPDPAEGDDGEAGQPPGEDPGDGAGEGAGDPGAGDPPFTARNGAGTPVVPLASGDGGATIEAVDWRPGVVNTQTAELYGFVDTGGVLVIGLGNTSSEALEVTDVLLDGRSIVGESASTVAARGIRRTFQTTQLFGGLTVLENVMAGCHADIRTGLFSAMFSTGRLKSDEREAEERAREALEFVRMTQFADRDAGQLSFGQSRMIEIARAIVSRPQVLLLDEPAVGLSLDRVHELEELIRRVRDERGVTIIMVEHVIRLVMNVCDRITVLSSGRKIAEGTADEVTRNDIVIEAYLGRKLDADSPQP